MNRQLRILMVGLLLPLAGCDYLPDWVPGAKPAKKATAATVIKTPAKSTDQELVDEDLPIEQQILRLQEEIQAVEDEKRKLQERRDKISSEKTALNELMKEQEADLKLKEREIKRLESGK